MALIFASVSLYHGSAQTVLPYTLNWIVASAIGTPTSIGVTATSSSGGASATSASLIITSAIQSNDLVVVCAALNTNNAVTASSVSDPSNSYTAIDNVRFNSTSAQISAWYVQGATAVAANGSNSITVNFSGASGANTMANIHAVRVSGIKTSGALDKFAHNSGSASSISVATGALTQAKEAIIGCGEDASGSFSTAYSGASGLTNLSTAGISNNGVSAQDYNLPNSISSVIYQPTWVASGPIAAIISTFEGR